MANDRRVILDAAANDRKCLYCGIFLKADDTLVCPGCANGRRER